MFSTNLLVGSLWYWAGDKQIYFILQAYVGIYDLSAVEVINCIGFIKMETLFKLNVFRMETFSENSTLGTISQKMYKCLPPSPVWKDNRQPPQSATENFPLLVWLWGHQLLTSELAQDKYTGIEMSPPQPFYTIILNILILSLNSQ